MLTFQNGLVLSGRSLKCSNLNLLHHFLDHVLCLILVAIGFQNGKKSMLSVHKCCLAKGDF